MSHVSHISRFISDFLVIYTIRCFGFSGKKKKKNLKIRKQKLDEYLVVHTSTKSVEQKTSYEVIITEITFFYYYVLIVFFDRFCCRKE